jgi:hypothetical protein
MKLAWIFTTRMDACLPDDYSGPVKPEWVTEPFLMISNVETGAIEEGSIRVLDDAAMKDFHLPTDGPYVDF